MQATHTPNLLSDALERAYSHSLLDATHQPLQVGKGIRTAGRARDMRYTRAPW